MADVFEGVRCVVCAAPHDVYVPESASRRRVYAFVCPATGQRVTLSPRGKMCRNVESVPTGAILAGLAEGAHATDGVDHPH